MKDDATARLRELQAAILAASDQHASVSDQERLLFCQMPHGIHIEFYGCPWEGAFALLLETLARSDVAASIGSLAFRGPDEGANGTRNWDFTPLISTAIVFPRLTSLFIEPTAPDHHNQTIVAETYEEDGQVARFLERAPMLRELTSPSAPDSRFFGVGVRPLVTLRIEAGYDTHDFLSNLSRSRCFPELRILDWGEYNQRYVGDYRERCTPFEQYRELFRSAALRPVRVFVLRNAVFDAAKFRELKALRPDLTFRRIDCSGEYV